MIYSIQHRQGGKQGRTRQTDHLRTFLPQAKTKESRSCDSLQTRAHTRAHVHWLALHSDRLVYLRFCFAKKQWSLKKKIENRRLVFFSFFSSDTLCHSLIFVLLFFFVPFMIVQCKIVAAGGVLSREKEIAQFSFAYGCCCSDAVEMLLFINCCVFLIIGARFCLVHFTKTTLIECICI